MSNTIHLMSSEGKPFSIQEPAAKLSLKLKKLIKVKDRVNNVIRLDNVKGTTLSKVIEYLRSKHVINVDAETLKLFEGEFVKNEDEVGLMYLMDAAKNLEIKCLYNVCCESLVDKLKDKTLHEMRVMLGREAVSPVSSMLIEAVDKVLQIRCAEGRS